MTPTPPPAKTLAKKTPEPENPRIFAAQIYVGKSIVAAVALKAATRTAAILAVNKMINVKMK